MANKAAALFNYHGVIYECAD